MSTSFLCLHTPSFGGFAFQGFCNNPEFWCLRNVTIRGSVRLNIHAPANCTTRRSPQLYSQTATEDRLPAVEPRNSELFRLPKSNRRDESSASSRKEGSDPKNTRQSSFRGGSESAFPSRLQACADAGRNCRRYAG